MSTINEYEDYFKPDEVPAALVKLIEFNATQSGWFSQGFELEIDIEDIGLKTYSGQPEFLDALFTIAQADCTGSSYAIWRQGMALADSSIVAFGSEGGAHVVAENLLGLFRILTLDAEILIDWKGAIYFKPADAEPSEGAADYAQWLAKNFQLKAVKDTEEATQIVTDAQKVHEQAFQVWLKRFHG